MTVIHLMKVVSGSQPPGKGSKELYTKKQGVGALYGTSCSEDDSHSVKRSI